MTVHAAHQRLEDTKNKILNKLGIKHRRRSRAGALSSALDGILEFQDLGPGPEPPDQTKRRYRLKAFTYKGKRKTLGDPSCCIPGSEAGSSSGGLSLKDKPIEFARGDQWARIMGLKRGPGWEVPARKSHAAKTTTYALLELRKTLKRKGVKTFPEKFKKFDSWLEDMINFADPRPRNQLGEFSPQGEGGPDPNAMAKVYTPPAPTSKRKLILEGGAAALGLGTAGAIGAGIGKQFHKSGTDIVKGLIARARKSKVR